MSRLVKSPLVVDLSVTFFHVATGSSTYDSLLARECVMHVPFIFYREL